MFPFDNESLVKSKESDEKNFTFLQSPKSSISSKITKQKVNKMNKTAVCSNLPMNSVLI